MELSLLYQDPATRGRGCPSVYLADSGELVVQGPELDDDSKGGLTARLPNETAVRVSPQVLLEALDRYRSQQ